MLTAWYSADDLPTAKRLEMMTHPLEDLPPWAAKPEVGASEPVTCTTFVTRITLPSDVVSYTEVDCETCERDAGEAVEAGVDIGPDELREDVDVVDIEDTDDDDDDDDDEGDEEDDVDGDGDSEEVGGKSETEDEEGEDCEEDEELSREVAGGEGMAVDESAGLLVGLLGGADLKHHNDIKSNIPIQYSL